MKLNISGSLQDKKQPRLYVYSLGFILQRRVRRILKAHGWSIKLGFPFHKNDAVAVWGRTNTQWRGICIAGFFNRPVITIEDSFLRSIKTGRQGASPVGLVIDDTGIFFDTTRPSALDNYIARATSLEGEKLKSIEELMAYMVHLELSKYNDFVGSASSIPDDFILVIDQTKDDASIKLGAADTGSFTEMLTCARDENPGKKILIKSHPESIAHKRVGYFSQADFDDQTSLITDKISPSVLFQKASKIYCVTSQMGLEAIFAGHRPIVFGRPFYVGLGLTDDRIRSEDKGVSLKPAQLFWATHLQYSSWYDHFFDRSTDLLSAARMLHARARHHKENQAPAVCVGMRLWKRGFIKRFLFLGQHSPLFFEDGLKAAEAADIKQARLLVWATKETEELARECAIRDVQMIRVEDGFLRSVGLGAQLVAPVSLTFDNTGIYYDATRPSQLEQIINSCDTLSGLELKRAKKLRERVVALNMTKYNLKAGSVHLSAGINQEIILVPGQVEDDASILLGTGKINTNLELLHQVRKDFPNAYIVYKPHPDVEAGLRAGKIDAEPYSDMLANNSNMAALLGQVDRVATMTSLTGFEALIRGKNVTCYGSPFYSGWGLTDDRSEKITRRKCRPSLDALVHACLIEYPRYWDPVTGIACPVEVVLERFEKGQMQPRTGFSVRFLAKLQGVFASYAHLWR